MLSGNSGCAWDGPCSRDARHERNPVEDIVCASLGGACQVKHQIVAIANDLHAAPLQSIKVGLYTDAYSVIGFQEHSTIGCFCVFACLHLQMLPLKSHRETVKQTSPSLVCVFLN